MLKPKPMKIKILVILISFFVVGCEKDTTNVDDQEISTFIWGPDIHAIKSSNMVTLSINDPRPYSLYVAPGPANPEYFNLYMSDRLEDFELYSKLTVTTTSATIENLVNDKPYYFYVSSHREGFDTVISDTLMTIPSTKVNPVEIQTNLSFSIESPALSPDGTYITFSSSFGPNESEGYDVLYYKSLLDNTIEMVGANSIVPSWSPNGDQFVYILVNTVAYTTSPSELRLFNTDQNTSTTLLEIGNPKYYIGNAQFSDDSERIYFLSSENNSEIYNYDIWTLDLDTMTKTKISDFEAIGFNPYRSFDWSSDDENVFLDGYGLRQDDYRSQIYRFEVATNTLTSVLDSQWRENRPILSPDNLRMAFVSDRSGLVELWVYSFDTSEYQQITGDIPNYFDSRYSNIQWLTNNELLINVFENRTSKLVSFKID